MSSTRAEIYDPLSVSKDVGVMLHDDECMS
jgi:hypothetical protein